MWQLCFLLRSSGCDKHHHRSSLFMVYLKISFLIEILSLFSHFWSSLWDLLQTKLKLSSAYHPQTDGRTERVNQVLEDMLRAFCVIHQHSWDQYLPYVYFAYNNSVHESTGYSPFFLKLWSTPTNTCFWQCFSQWTKSYWMPKPLFVLLNKDKSWFYPDKNRRFQTFKVDDMVLLHSKN